MNVATQSEPIRKSPDDSSSVASNPWRATILISVIALGVFLGVRWLPVGGGSLHYTDFRVGEKNFLEFCEPGSPQFVPVDRVHSPVTLTLKSDQPFRVDETARVTARLTASTGKPVTTADLLVVHTEKLHLLVVDASLEDYQHIHPTPTRVPGDYVFDFTPRRDGVYRVFADFTPRATGRGLYAGATVNVAPAPSAVGAAPQALSPSNGLARARESADARDNAESLATTIDGYRYTLALSKRPLRTNEGADLTLTVSRADGGTTPVVLETIMGASAHLVAFDEKCTGFAHLHPIVAGADVGRASVPAANQSSASTTAADASRLAFALKLTDPGFYRVWAQVKIEGRERFVPFGLRVEP